MKNRSKISTGTPASAASPYLDGLEGSLHAVFTANISKETLWDSDTCSSVTSSPKIAL